MTIWLVILGSIALGTFCGAPLVQASPDPTSRYTPGEHSAAATMQNAAAMTGEAGVRRANVSSAPKTSACAAGTTTRSRPA